MSAVIQFRKKKDQIRKALQDAVATGDRKPLKGRSLIITMALCLVGTTLAFQATTIFFSISFIIMLTYSLTNQRLQWSISRAVTITALVSMSILSGCGPLLSSPPDELITFCSDKLGSCNTGSSSTWLICGLPLKDISIKAAQAEGGIDQVIGIRNADGFGLIAVKQITVYGG